MCRAVIKTWKKRAENYISLISHLKNLTKSEVIDALTLNMLFQQKTGVSGNLGGSF